MWTGPQAMLRPRGPEKGGPPCPGLGLQARKWGDGSPVRARSREEGLADPDCGGTQPNQNRHAESTGERRAPSP